MSEQNSNSQAATVPPVPPAGPTLEEVQAQKAELEKSREGLLRDLQEERRKRQELEARTSQPAPAPSAAQPDVTQDELGKVLNPYLEPVKRKAEAAEAMLRKYEEDKALEYLALKLNKSKADVLADQKFQEKFVGTNKRWGVSGRDIYESTVKTYELMELEDLRQKDAERVRQNAASQSASMPSGTPPAPSGSKQVFTKEDFEKMDMLTYDKLQSNGSFVQDEKTGDITYSSK